MPEQFRIDTLSVLNFRGFESRSFQFHPEFNVLIGDNATGKTAALEALRVALSAWFLGIDGSSSHGFHDEDVRLVGHGFKGDYTFEQQYPVLVDADGTVGVEDIHWARSKQSRSGKTNHKWANPLKRLASSADTAVRAGEPVTLPMIAYYGTERLYGGVREQNPRTKAERELNKALRLIEGLDADERESLVDQLRLTLERADASKADLSRFTGYRGSMDPRINQRDLKRWMERQAWISFQERQETGTYGRVRRLLASMVEEADTLDYSATRNEVVVRFMREEGRAEVQPFSQLSDGQRNVIALAGDIASRMARLNPHFGDDVFDETPGVVLIDELDMHLHPTWQRRIAEQLRSAFPKIQFIVTSHSPLVIGETPPECVHLLGADSVGVPTAAQSYGLDANHVLTWVMGTKEAQAHPVIERLAQARLAIQQGHLDEAQDLSDHVRELQNGPTPDTVELDTLIANLEALADDEDDHQD